MKRTGIYSGFDKWKILRRRFGSKTVAEPAASDSANREIDGVSVIGPTALYSVVSPQGSLEFDPEAPVLSHPPAHTVIGPSPRLRCSFFGRDSGEPVDIVVQIRQQIGRQYFRFGLGARREIDLAKLGIVLPVGDASAWVVRRRPSDALWARHRRIDFRIAPDMRSDPGQQGAQPCTPLPAETADLLGAQGRRNEAAAAEPNRTAVTTEAALHGAEADYEPAAVRQSDHDNAANREVPDSAAGSVEVPQPPRPAPPYGIPDQPVQTSIADAAVAETGGLAVGATAATAGAEGDGQGSMKLPEPVLSLSEPGKIPEEPVDTWPTDLEVFGTHCEKADKWQLAAIARQKLGSAIHISFTRFVQFLRSENYRFDGFEGGQLCFDQRAAYLRYDVHSQDLLAAYVLAELHELLGIAGTFQINWKYSKHEEKLDPYFTKLLEFDRQFVRFGLHAAPTATWYTDAKLGGDYEKQDEAVSGDEFIAWLLELHAAYARDGDEAPELRRIREGTDDTLSRLAASFRETFGVWKSISGHGNFLTRGLAQARQKHPELAVLERYFNPVAYMASFGVERFGFDYEVTSVGVDSVPFPRVLFEGGREEDRRRIFHGRVANGAGFVALLHPATWTCRRNATFFLPEDATGRKD